MVWQNNPNTYELKDTPESDRELVRLAARILIMTQCRIHTLIPETMPSNSFWDTRAFTLGRKSVLSGYRDGGRITLYYHERRSTKITGSCTLRIWFAAERTVIGSYNAGKSTFLNALLRTDILSAGDFPTTTVWTITI